MMLASIAEHKHYRQKSIITNCLSQQFGAGIKHIDNERNNCMNHRDRFLRQFNTSFTLIYQDYLYFCISIVIICLIYLQQDDYQSTIDIT